MYLNRKYLPTVLLLVTVFLIPEINATDLVSKKYFGEVGIFLTFPKDYILEKSNEPNRRGSFLSYDFKPLKYKDPFLFEIQFFSKESIKLFQEVCSNRDKDEGSEEDFCHTGDYPTTQIYNEQKLFLQKSQKFKGKYQMKKFGNRDFIVSISPCSGDSCVIREYRTFIVDIMVAVWIMMNNRSQVDNADKLFSELKID